MKKPIAYLKLNHVLLCSAIGFTSLNAMAESTNNAINETLSVLRTNQGNLTIKGTISDKTGPIIGANVIIKGTTNGVITDIDGNFTLENVKKGDILQVSFIGYSTKEIKISNNNNLHIQLDEDTQSLEEVVVVGYGSQRKSDLTGGVTAVGEDKLGLVSTNNLMDKLAGQIPGLNISTGNAQPGEDQTLRIRGNNSLTASNDPLIVMDGIPYSGSLGDIDPDIIESMSVLKDASSAAIYGSRGSNGVILIQTKKGRQGKATVTYKGQVGMAETERRLDMMSGDEYLQYLYDYNHLKNGIPYDQLTPHHILYDMVYNPPLTAFLRHGQEHGCRISNGRGMLERQAEERARFKSRMDSILDAQDRLDRDSGHSAPGGYQRRHLHRGGELRGHPRRPAQHHRRRVPCQEDRRRPRPG